MLPKLSKEDLDATKRRAQDRISEWVQNVKTAGITRLQDRYGKVFRRIEWINEGNVPEKKHWKHKKGKQADQVKEKKITSERKRSGGKYLSKYRHHTPSPDKMDLSFCEQLSRSRSRQTPDHRCKSRQTPESRKIHQDGKSTVSGEHRRNISSHNRSSRGRATSICSIDAISLLCDDETETNVIPSVQRVLDKINKRIKEEKQRSILNSLEKANQNAPEVVRRREGSKEKETSRGDVTPNKSVSSIFQMSQRPRGSLYPIDGRRKSVFDRIDHNLISHLGKFTMPRKKRGTLMPIEDELDKTIVFVSEEDTDSRDKSSDSTQNLPTTSLSVKCTTSEPPRISVVTKSPSFRMNIKPTTPEQPINVTFTENLPMASLGVDTGEGMRTNSSLLIGSTQSRCNLNRPVSAVKVNKVGSFMLIPSKFTARVKSARARKHAAAKSNVSPAKTDTGQSTTVEVKKSSGKTFKRFVRKVICVLHLLHVTRDKVQIDLLAERLHNKNKSKEKTAPTKAHLAFDSSFFKAATTTYGGLSSRARDALWKQPGHRTEDDVRTLMEVMYRLPFFTKYSQSVKEELARVMWYDEFENGRVIIKQGDIGSRMYFVVSGCAAVQRTEIDPRTNEKLIVTLYDVHAGSTFGELALIRNLHRTNTVICKGKSEFLSLSKEEFNSVLRRDYEEMWRGRFDFFRNSKYFEKLLDDQIKQCADMSEIKEFPNNFVILGDTSKIGHHAYFIHSGKCQIVKKMEFVRSQSPYLRPSLFLSGIGMLDTEKFMDKKYGKQLRHTRAESHYLTIMTLFPGDFFGIGEDLRDTFIITKGNVECVLLNATIFSINWSENIKMREEREAQIPSNLELYRRYEANRRWMEYKKRTVEEVVKNRVKPHNTRLEDVPESIRNEPSIPADLL